MTTKDELYEARPGHFFGVYILYNRNPKHEGKIYIGFTVNPARRIRQHNREIKGGAWKTGRNKGPWDMVLINHGFHTSLAALQFEWAWQNPSKSRRLSHLPKRMSKEPMFTYRLRILSEMLNTGPWNRLPLTIQWLKQEYCQQFPLNRPPPIHMPIAYGTITTVKKVPSEKKAEEVATEIKTRTEEKDAENCMLCSAVEDEHKLLKCIVNSCDFVAHTICLAEVFLKQSNNQDKYVLPVEGKCPSCQQEMLWSDVIKQRRYTLNEMEFDDSQDDNGSEEMSDDDEFQ